jgi:hypothetical protein
MMMKRPGLVATALMLVLTLPLASRRARADLLVNGGFETGALTPWFQARNFGGTENWNVTSAVSHSGTFSATNVENSASTSPPHL